MKHNLSNFDRIINEKKFSVKDEVFPEQIHFSFSKDLKNSSYKFTFENCIFLKEFNLSSFDTAEHLNEKINSGPSIHFINCIFIGRTNLNALSEVTIQKCSFNSLACNSPYKLSIEGIHTNEFTAGTIYESLTIINKDFVLPKLVTDKLADLKIQNYCKESRLNFIKLESWEAGGNRGKITLNNLEVGIVEIKAFEDDTKIINCKINKALFIPGFNRKMDKYGSLLIENSFIDIIDIPSSNKNRFNFKNLHLTNVSFGESVKLRFVRIDNFKLNSINLDNNKNFTLQGIEFKNKVEIISSNLQNSVFFDITFSKNTKFILESSLITESTFGNIKWPDGFALYPWFAKMSVYKIKSLLKKDEHAIIEKLRIQIDSYRQLKKVSLLDKNNIEALAFNGNELRLYYLFNKLSKSNGLNLWDKILFRINYVFSRFGQSYIRPFAWLLAINLMFFWFYFQELSFDIFNGKYWEQSFNNYLNLINPFSAFAKNSGTGFLISVVNGFLIYHIIKAMRRFGKL